MSDIIKFAIVMVWMLLTAVIIMSVVGGLIMHVTGFSAVWGKIPEELYPEIFKIRNDEDHFRAK
jgi:hypothetical protein